MHFLGTIISVHFTEQERQHALKYSKPVLNSKARLQHLKMTGIVDDLLTKLEEFVYHIYSMRKKM